MRPLFLILILVLPVCMAESWCAPPTCFSENGIMVEVPRRSIDGVVIRDSLALNSREGSDINAWSKLYRGKGPIHK
uniref:Secreted protein n=1 Tax=Steinernema glaseri TaxID=37863 RepID=A0A1I7ZYI2_9BILA